MHLTLGSACSPSPRANLPDDPSVYVAAIEVLFARDSSLRQVVLAEEPLSIDTSAVRRAAAEMPILAARDSAEPSVSDGFLVATRAPSAVDIQSQFQGVAAVASKATLERLRAQADTDAKRPPQRYVTPIEPYWERFYLAYAPVRTLVRLSPAAYSRDRRRALVYVTYGCGPQCGGSYWVLLDREGTGWRARNVRQGYVV